MELSALAPTESLVASRQHITGDYDLDAQRGTYKVPTELTARFRAVKQEAPRRHPDPVNLTINTNILTELRNVQDNQMGKS